MNRTKSVPVSESSFARAFEDYLRLKGWRFAHFRPARTEKGWVTAMTGDPGFPDYVCVREKRLVFVELKAGRGKPTQAQQDWSEALSKVELTINANAGSWWTVELGQEPVQVYTWKPSDWPEIERLLA